MSRPVSYKVTPTQPATVYGSQLRVDAVDAKGNPTGSTYVNNEEEAAAWFADHQETCAVDTPAPAKKGATPKASTEKDV